MGAHAARRSRSRFSAEDRERLLAEFDRSGLSQYRFSLEHGLSQSLLSRWVADRSRSPGDSLPSPRVIPVRVVEDRGDTDRSRSEPIRLRIDDRVTIEVSRNFDRATLLDVLSFFGIERC